MPDTGAILKVGTSEGLGAPNSLNVGIENAEIGKATFSANHDFATGSSELNAAGMVGGLNVGANFSNTYGNSIEVSKKGDLLGGEYKFNFKTGNTGTKVGLDALWKW